MHYDFTGGGQQLGQPTGRTVVRTVGPILHGVRCRVHHHVEAATRAATHVESIAATAASAREQLAASETYCSVMWSIEVPTVHCSGSQLASTRTSKSQVQKHPLPCPAAFAVRIISAITTRKREWQCGSGILGIRRSTSHAGQFPEVTASYVNDPDSGNGGIRRCFAQRQSLWHARFPQAGMWKQAAWHFEPRELR